MRHIVRFPLIALALLVACEEPALPGLVNGASDTGLPAVEPCATTATPTASTLTADIEDGNGAFFQSSNHLGQVSHHELTEIVCSIDETLTRANVIATDGTATIAIEVDSAEGTVSGLWSPFGVELFKVEGFIPIQADVDIEDGRVSGYVNFISFSDGMSKVFSIGFVCP